MPFQALPAPALPASGEVHLWHIALDVQVPVDGLIEHLPGVEAQRAKGIGHPAVRRRFAICQTALRNILAAYLTRDPVEIGFTEGPWGKPALSGPAAASGLAFNLTHSRALALLAITRDRVVGVDVEQLRPLPAAQDLAERYFSARECEDLRRVAGTGAEALTFFQCWTRKEAFVKALGEGLTHPLDSFAVSCLPDEPARLLWCRGDPSAPSQWSVASFEPAPGYVAAVATPGGCEVTAYRFSSELAPHPSQPAR